MRTYYLKSRQAVLQIEYKDSSLGLTVDKTIKKFGVKDRLFKKK